MLVHKVKHMTMHTDVSKLNIILRQLQYNLYRAFDDTTYLGCKLTSNAERAVIEYQISNSPDRSTHLL